MLYTQALPKLIEEAYGDLFKQADALKDRLDFKAAESNRTPLEMVVECVTSPMFLADTIKNQALAPMDEETWEKPGFESLEQCKAAWDEAKPALFEAIQNFPSEKLEEQIVTPWGTFSWYSFMAYCYWNPMWHAGQLAYIQMMHGDTDMHF
jgi:hypothetical protein